METMRPTAELIRLANQLGVKKTEIAMRIGASPEDIQETLRRREIEEEQFRLLKIQILEAALLHEGRKKINDSQRDN